LPKTQNSMSTSAAGARPALPAAVRRVGKKSGEVPAEMAESKPDQQVGCAETPMRVRGRRAGAATCLQIATPDTEAARRSPRTLPAEVYTRDEVDRLIRAASKRAPSGIRNRALIGLLYSSGLRIAEALALKPADVDRDVGTVRVLRGKGAKARTVGINATAIALIDRWLDVRRQLGISSGRPLFCGISKHSLGTPVDDSYVRRLLPRLARKAGITKRVHAHGLRHTLAVELLREGASPVLIQGVLGHGNLAITNDYLAHLEPREVVQWQKSRNW
jgi:site-specific recombinase XerD